MNELSPEAKVLFRVARDAFSPSASRVMATYAALEARASVPTSKAPAPSGSATLSPTGWGLWRLIGLGVLVTIGTGYAVIGSRFLSEANNLVADDFARGLDAKSVAPREPVTSPQTSPAVRQASDLQEDEAVSASVKRDKVVGVSKVRDARSTSHQRRKPNAPIARPLASEDIDDSLSQEIALLRGARAALERRDAAEALVLLDRHKTLYPLGTLKQEQLVTRVLALCVLGRDLEARAVAREFMRVAPASPHLARIRASCAGALGSASNRAKGHSQARGE